MEERIVVVDDDVVILKNANRILSDKGMNVTCLKSGKLFLDYVEKNSIDMLLLDIKMPEMDGFETLSKLRELEKRDNRQEIPVIFFTGADDVDTEAKGLKLGAMDYIRKPFAAEVLSLRVRHLLDLIRLQRDLNAEVERKTREIEGFDDQQDPEKTYRFYGWETADIKDGRGLTPRNYYDLLKSLWSKETCAPRLQSGWSTENPTLGQCSVTAFLMQDIYGGKVYGIPRGDGNFHCFNSVDGCVFDLTSEQFGDEKLDYSDCPEQFREVHFRKEEKRQRYELLKKRLECSFKHAESLK